MKRFILWLVFFVVLIGLPFASHEVEAPDSNLANPRVLGDLLGGVINYWLHVLQTIFTTLSDQLQGVK